MWGDGQLGTQMPKTQRSKAELRGREVHAGQSGLGGGEGGSIDKRVEDIAQWWSGTYRGGGFHGVSCVASRDDDDIVEYTSGDGVGILREKERKKVTLTEVGELRSAFTGHVTAKLCFHHRWAVAKPRAVSSPMPG